MSSRKIKIEKFVVHSAAEENPKVLNCKKNG